PASDASRLRRCRDHLIVGHADVRERTCSAAVGEASRGLACDVAIALRQRRVRLGGDRGPAVVRLLADAGVERQLSEQLDAELLRQALAAAGAEDRFLVTALGADV